MTMSYAPPPSDVPETRRRDDEVLTVSGSMPRSGHPGLPHIILTESHRLPASGADAGTAAPAAAYGDTWQRGDQTLTISGSMSRTGHALPALTLPAESTKAEDP